MKTRTKVIVAASALVLLGGLTAAGISQADNRRGGYYGEHHGGYGMGYGEQGMGRGFMHDGEHGMGRGGMHGDDRGARMGGGMMNMFDAFDADGDGKLTQAEIDQVRAKRLGDFDADGDGKLSLAEYQALWLDAMRERMVDRFQAHDADGDGFVTAAEFGERYHRMVARMDRNGDGVLSRDEMMEPRGRSRDKDDDRD